MIVLIIDDDESIRNCFRRFLEREGHTVYEYNRAEGAEDYALKMRPDLVLIDHNLGPRGTTTGLEIAGPLQREGQRVILMSGDSTVGGFAALANVDFVEKHNAKSVIEEVCRTADRRLQDINVQGSTTGRWNGREGVS